MIFARGAPRDTSLQQDGQDAEREHQERRNGRDRQAGRGKQQPDRTQQSQPEVHSDQSAAVARLAAACTQVRHVLR
jgi:hypothetical protein